MDQEAPGARANAADPQRYQTPKIEMVLTPEDLEREVQYAGVPSQPPGGIG